MFDPWPKLVRPECDQLLASVRAEQDLDRPAAVDRLRRLGDAELVAAAIELVQARRRAEEKFPDTPALLADVAAVEQATSADVAAHKARRFAGAGVDRVVDLCCGMGGDGMGLAQVADVLLVDSLPRRVCMARWNVGQAGGRVAGAVVADAGRLRMAGEAFHIDPDRRHGGRRLRFDNCRPGPDLIRRLVGSGAPGAVKLSPAVDLQELPPGEIEIIERAGRLVQAVLWTGSLARDQRSATRVQGDRCVSFAGAADQVIPVAPPGRLVLAVEAAIERAGLLGALCAATGLAAVHPALGLLTADAAEQSPWYRRFELLDVLPWRPRKVKQWLEAHDGGIVEVKTRGQACEPDQVQRQLRGRGVQPFTVFVLRSDRRVQAWMTRRIEST